MRHDHRRAVGSRRPVSLVLSGWLLIWGVGLAFSTAAETLYSPFGAEETAQRISQVFSRYGLEARREDGTRQVSANGKERVIRLRVESPAQVVDASRCRWADAYGRPIEVEVRGGAHGSEVVYSLPPKRVNAFGVIECGKTHDDLTQAMYGLMELALSRSR